MSPKRNYSEADDEKSEGLHDKLHDMPHNKLHDKLHDKFPELSG